MVQGQHGAIPSNPGIRPRLTEIASVFARYGNLTFGGGSATIAVLQHEIETGRPWINRDQFRLCFGLSRLTPGTNLLAFCTGVGWLTRGGPGAVVALMASSLPCSILAVAVTAVFDIWAHNPFMEAALARSLGGGSRHYCLHVLAFDQIYPFAVELDEDRLRRGRIHRAFGHFSLSPIRVLLLAALAGAIWPRETTR